MSKKSTEKYDNIVWQGRKRRLGLPLSFTRYILTSNKLYTSTGFFNIHEERTELYRVIDFTLELPLGQRIFGCGTIIVHAKDKSSSELMLKSIKKPRMVMKMIEDCVEQERKKYKIHGRDMVATAGALFGDDSMED